MKSLSQGKFGMLLAQTNFAVAMAQFTEIHIFFLKRGFEECFQKTTFSLQRNTKIFNEYSA